MTFLVNLDEITMDTCKELIGFILTIGLNFRKIDRRLDDKTEKILFIETETEKEKNALSDFLYNLEMSEITKIDNENKVFLNEARIGIFKRMENEIKGDHFVDLSTNKKFKIIKGG